MFFSWPRKLFWPFWPNDPMLNGLNTEKNYFEIKSTTINNYEIYLFKFYLNCWNKQYNQLNKKNKVKVEIGHMGSGWMD